MTWKKTRTVAWFEFSSTVTRKGYLISTFGMPLFLLLYGAVATIPGMMAGKGEGQTVKTYGVVDHSGLLGLDEERQVSVLDLPDNARAALGVLGERSQEVLAWGNAVFVPFDTLDPAREALRDGQIQGIYKLDRDYLETGKVVRYRTGTVKFSMSDSSASGSFEKLIRASLLEGRLPEEVRTRLDDLIAVNEVLTLDEEGNEAPLDMASMIARFAIPALISFLLFLSLMMTSGFLMQGMAAEKENKVVEVILASANPDEILLGKLLGLGVAGLLQVAVWSAMVFAGVLVVGFFVALAGVQFPWMTLVVGILYFVVTYFFLGSLILASSSLGGTLKESQQFSMIWTLLPVAPMFVMPLLLQAPNGWLARGLTWFPFTSVVTLLLRLTMAPKEVPWIDLIGPFFVLLISIWFAIRLGGRLFRVGLLLSGARPSVKELWRQARLS